MASKMLIDAAHPEETRVVAVKGNRVEEFDYESASKKQLRGNIYLAKVTRVEPSLQAAFVDYGGGKHGFLPFAEIHPDYYQIPTSDRGHHFEEATSKEESDDGIAKAIVRLEESGIENSGAEEAEIILPVEATTVSENADETAENTENNDDGHVVPANLEEVEGVDNDIDVIA